MNFCFTYTTFEPADQYEPFWCLISLPGISIFTYPFFIDTYIYANYKQIFCLCVVLNKITFLLLRTAGTTASPFLISHTILSLLLTSHCIIFIVVVSNFPIRMAVVHLEFPSNKTNKVTNFFHQIGQFFVCKRCFHIVIPIDFS